PGFMDCIGYHRWGCCGVIPNHLMAGPWSPSIAPADQKLWNDYLSELSYDDRQDIQDVWDRADFEGRRRLLGLLAALRKEQEKERTAREPLTQMEIDRWKAYLKTLKGDALKKAEADWEKADNLGRRKMLEALPK